MKFKTVCLFIVLLGFMCVSAGFAQEAKEIAKIGPADLKASLDITEKYDSNIFLTSSDRKEDAINVVTPKIELSMPLGEQGRHKGKLEYQAEIGTFANYDQENYVNQDLGGNLEFKLPKGYLTLKDLVRWTSDRSGTEFTQQVKRTENKGDVLLGIDFNKLTQELGYTNFSNNYESSDYADIEYTEHTYTATTFYQMFPKTKALIEYNHGEIDYKSNSLRDGDYNQGRVGLKGDLTGKTTGLVKAGYQKREYDEDEIKGYEGLTTEVGVKTKFSQRTELELKLTRSPFESTYGDNAYYTANQFLTTLTQKLGEKFTLVGAFGYDKNMYPEEDTDGKKRKDDVWLGQLSLQYSIKDWVKAKLSTEYKEDVSNIDSKDYKRNLTSLSVTFLL